MTRIELIVKKLLGVSQSSASLVELVVSGASALSQLMFHLAAVDTSVFDTSASCLRSPIRSDICLRELSQQDVFLRLAVRRY